MTSPFPYPQGRFTAVRMMDVDMIERGNLGNGFTAEQVGGDRGGPVIVSKNDYVADV